MVTCERNFILTITTYMWTPADKYAVPSADDRFKAEEAILELKVEIANAVAKLAAAQRRLDDLNKELLEREAWIAPVRRLSFDSLAIIFTMTSEMEPMAPMAIASVCRLWREIVISTPRAWSLIDLHHEMGFSYLQLFLSRSGQIGLHIGVARPYIGDKMNATLVQMADRIECLSIPFFPNILRESTFPVLKRLTVTSERYRDILMNLRPSRLPRLIYLDISNPARLIGPPVDVIQELPPLRSLLMCVDNGPTLFNTLTTCANSLTTLELYFIVGTQLMRKYAFLLPKLEGLKLDWMGHYVDNAPILVIPKLKLFFTNIRMVIAEFPIQVSFDRVTHLRIQSGALPSLCSFQALQNLQLHVPPDIFATFLSCLLHDSSTCPDLESIELGEVINEVECLTVKINLCHGRRISLSLRVARGIVS